MSITLNGAISSGSSEDLFGSKGSSSGQNNGLFANFSTLLTSISSEDPDPTLGHETFNVHLNKINKVDAVNVSAIDFLGQIISDDMILVDDKLDNLISEEGFEGLVSHLENGGNLDGSIQINATSAFIESRLEILSSEPSVDHNSGHLALLTVKELFAASEKIYDIGKGLSEQGTLNENVHILNDLMIGMPNQLELNGTDTSSILFDIRDLKNSLNEASTNQSIGFDLENVADEFIIPQVVPINVKNPQISNDTYAPFVAVKVELFGPEGDLEMFGLEGDLGAIEFSDLPSTQTLGVNPGISGVTRTVEIGSDIDTRSKLLIGLSIPENSDFRKLPDFVRLKVGLASESNKSEDTELTQISHLDKSSKVSPLMGINESSDSRDVAKQLILSLQEMSGGSSASVKIVAKTASGDAVIPSIDITRVSISDLDTSSLKLDVKETVSMGELSTSDRLAQYRAIFDKEVKFVPLLDNDVRSRVALSAISFEENLKHFHKVKETKSAPISEVFNTKGLDQKGSTLVFNPKSFLEAAEVLKMKPISFSNRASKADQQMNGTFDTVGVTSTKVYNQTSPQSGSSGNPNGFSQSLNNTISLYDAQYSSRISMLVVDKVLNGSENFEIHLEPESFGKIKVNVLMDKQALDIRMFAETQTAAILLRAGEDSLLQIANQNGMKLTSFSVGMQSGADQQKQNSNQNRNKDTGQANGVLERAGMQNSQTAISYRTPTGLNLIA
ncbi:MAG: flagellar hook-length control protein FliK [Ascidiaceihabitans sp.]